MNDIHAENEAALFAATDPLALFEDWMAAARATEPDYANAMSVASVDADGMPNSRIVLMQGLDGGGFVFYTNFESAKGRELLNHGKAALCFHWKSQQRQVRARGLVEPVSKSEADAYFATRPRGSQIGAWASAQSHPLEDRATLEARVREIEAKYDGRAVPRPPHWSGFRIVPLEIEFWQERAFRLHDRRLFQRATPSAPWSSTRLYP
jgi:pyridoxamine 5'-phosphate oxidase